MADIDFNTLLPESWNYPGLSRAAGLAMLQDLSNKLYSDPSKAQEINAQMQEFFGPQIAESVINSALPTIGSTPVSTTDPTGQNLAPIQTTVADLLQNQAQSAAQNTNPTMVAHQPLGSNNPGDAGGLFRSGDLLNYGNPNADLTRILGEADFARKTSLDTLGQQRDQRSKYLSDLTSILEKQQARQLSLETPGLYEDLNSRGLLHSSAVGDQLSRRQQELAAATSEVLAKQGLTDNEAYTAGLGDVTSNYLNSRNQGLSRLFSLQDLNTNIKASKELGFALQPQPQQSSGKGMAGIGGASAGAGIGANFGPIGAGVGAVLGGVAGAGSKKSGK